jgi:metalloendopeptidase OMA1, mitochondrial
MLARLLPSLAARPRLFRPTSTSSLLATTSRSWVNQRCLPFHTQPHTISRSRSAFSGPQGTRRSYSRRSYRGFAPSNIAQRWRLSPDFRRLTYLAGGGVLGFVGYNMEQVPVTGRWRFNCVPASFLENTSEGAYQQMLQEFGQSMLPEWSPEVQRVKRVLERLIPHSGLSGATAKPWTIHVVQADEPNAFVMPGRHVFVFTGILPLTKGDGAQHADDGLATVLGHEIAHNVADHSAENMSRYAVLIAGALAFSLFFDVSNQLAMQILDLAYNRPGSRAQETEADHIGLMMMAEACYDPRAALEFWDRMEKANKVKIPQFLSTHPADANRIKRIRGWMDDALAKRESSGCMKTGSWMDDFSSLGASIPFR